MKSRLAALVATCMAVLCFLTLSLITAPARAFAASCTFPTFSFYPGSSIPPEVRYGQVDFYFEACSDQKPSQWTARVTKQHVNSTGQNLGFFINGASANTVGVGDFYRRQWRDLREYLYSTYRLALREIVHFQSTVSHVI